jgi:Mg-chelatase subunit ChlD
MSLCCGQSLFAQFPITLKLDARSGTPVLSPPTKQGYRYRITVSGTYSQWPQFSDCKGVDAVWIYDVPQEEIDGLRWPPEELNGVPFVQIPHWVGDTTEYAFPPAELGIPPLFAISFKKYLGFRINGEPLPALKLDTVFHRYQQERAGTGDPFEFAVLDSTYTLTEGKVLPRYEDNCGSLTILVEEIPNVDINVCNVEPMVVNGQMVGLRVDAGVFRLDSTSIDGTRNLLTSSDQIGIVVDGRFICPDSLVCDTARTKPLSIGIIVDVSGSMAEPIQYAGGLVSRIDAVKEALRTLVKSLRKGDTLFIMKFSETVVLALDWTDNTQKVNDAIDDLMASGGTAFHQALITGVQKANIRPAPNKLIIALTDGLNNREPANEQVVLDILKKTQIPLFIIGLGFGNKPAEQTGIASMKRFVAAAPKGAYYQIDKGDDLVNAYKKITDSIATEDCCRLYFRIPPCDLGQSQRTMRLVFLNGNEMIWKSLVVPCDVKTTGIRTRDRSTPENGLAISSLPTPATDIATILVDLPVPTNVTIEMVNINGHRVYTRSHGMTDMGRFKTEIPVDGLPSGVYLCRIITPITTRTTRVIIKH